MKLLTLLCCALVVTGIAFAQDIRQKVKSPDEVTLPSRIIDPDEGIFGIPFDTSEDELIERLGKPDGYLRLTGNESCMIYGTDIAFLLEDGRLHGVRITHSIIDWRISRRMPRASIFHGLQWKLSNGIQYETGLHEVKRILGDELAGDSHNRSYSTDNATVHLNLSHYVGEGDEDGAYKVYGIMVEKR